MDLSLQGSQINLAARHKPKAAVIKYPLPQRPGSANFTRLHRVSPSLRRPFSADQKLTKNLDNCIRFSEKFLNEAKLRKSKKFWSTSSSNLLKLLLDEPIKRPWLCRDLDSNSENSLGQQICNFVDSKSIHRDSCEDLATEEDIKSISTVREDQVSFQCSKGLERSFTSNNSDTKMFNNNLKNTETDIGTVNYANMSSSMLNPTKPPTNQVDFWHDSKPDLPGRVSFGKSDIYEVDAISDYENDNRYPEHTSSLSNMKKSVHFKENVDVTASIYEYPKCSTEHCTCERNITPAPKSYQPETEKLKCMCEFTCNSSDYTSLPMSAKLTNHGTQDSLNGNAHNFDESDVIKQYKEAIRDENSSISQCNEHLAVEKQRHIPDASFNRDQSNKLNNATLCPKTYFNNDSSEKYCSVSEGGRKDSYKLESFEQNDLSNTRNIPNRFSFSSDIDKEETNSHEELLSPVESSNPVIKNYIQVMRAPIRSSKKQNNSCTVKKNRKTFKTRRSKSASASDMAKKNKAKLYKAETYSCLREDSNLDEFHLDRIDSWMSLHKRSPDNDQQFKKPKQQVKKYSPEEYEEIDSTDSPEPPKSEDVSQDSSTYDEIVSVIKEIEEDKKIGKSETTQVNMDLKLQTLLQSDLPNTSSTAKESPASPDKLKDILNYLDDVENSCDKTLMETRRSLPESIRSEVVFTVEPDIIEDVPKLSDLLMLPNHQLARRVVALSLRANELANAIHLSKEHVTRIRLETQKSLRLEKQNANNRLREQKKHYESIVGRHQGFIEQLLKDKATLCEKVTTLTRRIDSQNQAWEHKLETEVARVKETTLAGEKIRRERWVRENTKKIKELTVKGLEAEINKMNNDHQQEVLELKRRHQQELLDALEEARLKYEEMEKSVRESCAKDRESTIEKERNALRERFDRQLQEEQKVFDEQKSKLLEDLAAERERLQNDMRQKENDSQTKVQELLREKEIALERAQAEYREKLEQQEQKFQNKINTIEKQFESDYLIWKREFENTCKLREVDNENAIRQHYRTERDRQIDVIVTRMDAESQKNQEEFENKLSRLKEKHENDIREAESLEKSLREKYNDARSKLAEADAEVQNCQAEIKQLHLELDHSKKMCDELLIEKEEKKENLRNEVQHEIANIKEERDNEIQKIYKRVQQAIEKKDATLEVLQKENVNLRERCIKLEAIIRQQRKDYCIK